MSKYHSEWQKPRKSKRLDRKKHKKSLRQQTRRPCDLAGISIKLVELHAACQMDLRRDRRRIFIVSQTVANAGGLTTALAIAAGFKTFKFRSGSIGHKGAGLQDSRQGAAKEWRE
jgi:hypothetical protein